MTNRIELSGIAQLDLRAKRIALGEIFCADSLKVEDFDAICASMQNLDKLPDDFEVKRDEAIERCGLCVEFECDDADTVSKRLFGVYQHRLAKLNQIERISKARAAGWVFYGIHDDNELVVAYDKLLALDEDSPEVEELIEAYKPVELYQHHAADALVEELLNLKGSFETAIHEAA